MNYGNVTIFSTIVVGLSESIKRLGVNPKYIPIIDIILGITISIIYEDQSIRKSLMEGILIGFSASGIFSSVKNLGQVCKNTYKKQKSCK